jgi:hypothetical protein
MKHRHSGASFDTDPAQRKNILFAALLIAMLAAGLVLIVKGLA